MPANGSLGRVIAVSVLALACAAPIGFWALSTPSLAGEGEAPFAYSVSSFFGESAFLGVSLEEETEYAEGGARVVNVVDDSPADEAGLERGDIIVGFDGRTIRGPRALTRAMADLEPGDRVSLTVVREGREQSFDVELGKREGFKSFALPHLFDCDGEDDDCEEFTFNFGSPWGRPLLGVQLVQVTDELRDHLGGDEGAGVLVSKIVPDSAAEDAGIRVGDLIVAVDGRSVESAADIRRALEGKQGETFPVEVIRDRRPLALDVSIPERDDDRPSGPRALHLAPRIEGLQGQIDEVLEQIRQALGNSAVASGVQLETRAQREALQDALRARREALRQSREVRRDAAERAREALRRSREARSLL